jgi:hypothetical protein
MGHRLTLRVSISSYFTLSMKIRGITLLAAYEFNFGYLNDSLNKKTVMDVY